MTWARSTINKMALGQSPCMMPSNLLISSPVSLPTRTLIETSFTRRLRRWSSSGRRVLCSILKNFPLSTVSKAGFPQLLKNHWNSDLFQDHGKIIEFHEKFVKMQKSWKIQWILDQSLMEKSLYPCTMKLLLLRGGEGYIGFTLSVCMSVCPSVCLSVPHAVSALLCDAFTSGWILSILGTNDHQHQQVYHTQWPLTLTYISKVIKPCIWNKTSELQNG